MAGKHSIIKTVWEIYTDDIFTLSDWRNDIYEYHSKRTCCQIKSLRHSRFHGSERETRRKHRNPSSCYPGSRKSRLRFQPAFHEKKCDRRYLLHYLPGAQRDLKLHTYFFRTYRRHRTGMPKKRIPSENLPAL